MLLDCKFPNFALAVRRLLGHHAWLYSVEYSIRRTVENLRYNVLAPIQRRFYAFDNCARSAIFEFSHVLYAKSGKCSFSHL